MVKIIIKIIKINNLLMKEKLIVFVLMEFHIFIHNLSIIKFIKFEKRIIILLFYQITKIIMNLKNGEGFLILHYLLIF